MNWQIFVSVFLIAVLVIRNCAATAIGPIVIGPGVQPSINVRTNVDYHLLNGTMITSASLTGPPATSLIVDEAIEFAGGGFIQIDGGQYYGGDAKYTGPYGSFATVHGGHALRLRESRGEIHGGEFIGGDAYTTTYFGGTAIAGLAAGISQQSELTIYDGRFYAGVPTDIGETGIPIYYPGSGPLAITVNGRSRLNILGGAYFGLIFVSRDSTAAVYGKNLEQVGHSVYGNYANGRPLSLHFYPEGTIQLINVPEPKSIIFLMIAATAMLVASRR